MKYWRVVLRFKNPYPEQVFYWALDDDTGPYQLRTDQGDLLPGGLLSSGIPRQTGPVQDVSARLSRFHRDATIEMVLSPFQPGQYHPRIFRPRNQPSTGRMYEDEWLDSVSAVRNILFRLEDAFRVLEPRSSNDNAFGHELRQLLILACTEVESACKSVMKANGYPAPNGNRWKTTDYVKLLSPLYLDKWELSLTRHPKYKRFAPFGTWTSTAPTSSLDWYDAYNRTKHDRENHLNDATMRRVIHAAGAAYLLVVAQFGQFGFASQRVREVDLFQVCKVPDYSLEHHYVPPEIAGSGTWTPTHHPL